MVNVGIIGTGLMGKAIAKRLLSTGYGVYAYDRTMQKAEGLRQSGASILSSPIQVASASDIVLTVVSDASALEHVLFGEHGLANCGKRGLIVANVSTISPYESVRVAEKLSAHGMDMLDTPVMGGPFLAESGRLVTIVSGRKEVYEGAKDVIGAFSQRVYFVGPQGFANVLKLALNLQVAANAVAISEGISLCRAYGVDPSIFIEILNSTDYKTGISERKGPKMVAGNFEKTFDINLMLKDMRLAVETARELRIDLPLSSLTEFLFRAASSYLKDVDYTAILSFLEKINRMGQ